MNRTNWPFVLLCIGIFLAPIFGGRLAFEPQAIDPKDLLYGVVIDGSLPTLSCFAIALFVSLAFVSIAVSKQVLLLPAPKFLLLIVMFWFGLGISISQSQFLHDSILEFSKWTVYLVALVTVIATTGRDGVARLIWIIATSVTVISFLGLLEYSNAPDSNWRVFSVWMNPNAFAGVLALCLPAMLGLLYQSNGIAQKSFSGICIATSFGALWVTGSKGGLLAFSVGFIALILFGLLEVFRNRHRRQLLLWIVSAIFLFAIGIGMPKVVAPKSDSGTVSSRIFDSGKDSEQSVGFRKKLWAESLKIAKNNLTFGTGIGTYASVLPRYSTIEGSKVAHNSFVQLLAECGPITLFVFVLLGLIWFSQLMSNHPGVPERVSWIRAGVFGSVVAGTCNLMFESGLSYFGFSILFFSLLGCGILVSRDGARPEKTPLVSRAVLSIGAGMGATYYLWASGYAQYLVGSSKFEFARGNFDIAITTLDSAKKFAPSDAYPWIEKGRIYAALGKPEVAETYFQKAALLRPTSSSFALLARSQMDSGKLDKSEFNFRKAITYSKHDPRWRARLFDFYISQDRFEEAELAAENVVETESSDYYKYDALPQFVKLDTLDAHLFLAKFPERKIAHLESAFNLLAEYRRKTYFELKRMVGNSGQTTFEVMPGESLAKAEERFEMLKKVGEELKSAYKAAEVAPKIDVDKIINELRSG